MRETREWTLDHNDTTLRHTIKIDNVSNFNFVDAALNITTCMAQPIPINTVTNPVLNPPVSSMSFYLYSISSKEVQKTIRSLKSHGAKDCYGISSSFIKKFSLDIASMLSFVYSMLLEAGPLSRRFQNLKIMINNRTSVVSFQLIFIAPLFSNLYKNCVFPMNGISFK